MATRIITIANNDGERMELFEVLTNTGVTQPVRLQGQVVVQVSGTATSVSAIVEHCTRDPASTEANWAPADDTAFSGDLSAGMAPRPYAEPAVGWWRVRVSSISGGDCKVSIIGEKA